MYYRLLFTPRRTTYPAGMKLKRDFEDWQHLIISRRIHTLTTFFSFISLWKWMKMCSTLSFHIYLQYLKNIVDYPLSTATWLPRQYETNATSRRTFKSYKALPFTLTRNFASLCCWPQVNPHGRASALLTPNRLHMHNLLYFWTQADPYDCIFCSLAQTNPCVHDQ